MRRRAFLKSSAASALSLAFGGCAPAVFNSSQGRRLAFPSVLVSEERVIRTTVGLRPHRPSGFLLRPQRLDGKTVIHNYGHGGSGMSLCWGTAHLAAEMALGHTERSAAVLGCGIVGLTAARVLQRRGFDVTIYARELPPYTTSNMSWAGFTPNSSLVTERTPAWDAQFRKAVEIAYREHQLLAGQHYGVSWIYSYFPVRQVSPTATDPSDGAPQPDGAFAPLLPPTVEVGTELLPPGRHPFQTRFARRQAMLRFEPSIYLDALMRDVIGFGGRIVVRDFETPRDLMALPENLIINCTGLGAKALFGDDELIPIKGQLTVLVPQPEIDFSIGGMLPRRDGIVLGHVQQRGVWSLTVDEEERDRVLENAIRTFSTLRTAAVGADTGRVLPELAATPPVEAFFGLSS